ncbi:dolichyl-diphosphooligosaccharide-protein glycosyltransferase subunit [Thraustotheca clavata]|uniref:dolichyl-diphosphooligosaccharide--protein glycotransferase n=1 Tax=Thraustotheca clavata TaxID=74557 RepID=A0A1W0A0D2_9STRA|nr:dolichyl-diphosphooligosaccharide-protein glycosyltransferase subunit [Thraustotheca clavata]
MAGKKDKTTKATETAPRWIPAAFRVKQETNARERVLCAALLGLICVLAIAIRLFSVAKWGRVIHEYDPQFNFRTSKFLATNSFDEFLNWFDDRAWYPLGRVVGGTLYPGLMMISASIYRILHYIGFPISILDVCVYFAPFFAAATSIATYALTYHVTKQMRAGLLAAFFIAISPAYISRSVGGSYDNEGVAIFLLVLVFYLWVRSVDSGSMVDAALTAIAYFAMVLSWGGYVFLINVIPIHALILVFSGRFTPQLYIAYCTFYILGTMLAMQVPFVGFNVIQKAECIGSHGVFGVLQVFAFGKYLQSQLQSSLSSQQIKALIQTAAAGLVGIIAFVALVLQLTGKLQWTGRSLTLLDPTYASKYIPIIASVSEHQPTSWSSFYMSFGPVLLVVPLGLYYLFATNTDLTPSTMFVIIYSTLSWYFAGIMNRLVLTLAPAACVLAAIAISGFLDRIFFYLERDQPQDIMEATGFINEEEDMKADKVKKIQEAVRIQGNSQPPILEGEDIFGDLISHTFTAIHLDENPLPERKTPGPIKAFIGIMTCFLIWQHLHSSSISSKAYSSTSLVHEQLNRTTWEFTIHDDFREAFSWLRHNTDPNARILSWWDYGYQISSLANRTVLVDNNTWNNTHIATVGRVFGSTEAEALPIVESLGVDYIFLLFGGASSFDGDDLDKFPWFLRIAQGVFPDTVDIHRFQVDGHVQVAPPSTDAMKQCLLYKMSYYRFEKMQPDFSKPLGYDTNRNAVIQTEPIELNHFEEVFTSNAWVVRIYKVKKQVFAIQPLETIMDDTAEVDTITMAHSLRALGSSYGRGTAYVAAKNITQGETILTMSLNSIMSAYTAQEGKLKAFYDANPTLPNAVVLALHVLEEKFKGIESNWYPFLNSLPQELHGTIFLSEEEMDLIHNSQLYRLTQAREDAISQFFEAMYGPLTSSSLFDPLDFTLEAFRWAMSIVWAHSILIPKGSDVEALLVPMVSTMKHSNDVENKFDVNFDTNIFTMIASKAYRIGDPVDINLGPSSMALFMLNYGFCPDASSLDHVPITIQVEAKDPLKAFKNSILAMINTTMEAPFILSYGSSGVLADTILQSMRVKVMTSQEIEMHEAIVKNERIGLRNEFAMCRALLHTCNTMLAAYEYSLDDLRRMLPTITGRRRDLVRTVVMEQEILHATKADLLEYWQSLLLDDQLAAE